jgi:hypothetical protein
MYQQRIELCLEELHGGQSKLEIGNGSGVSFLNLNKLYQEIYGLDLPADSQLIAGFFNQECGCPATEWEHPVHAIPG